MTRLAETFEALRARRGRALIPYFTAGDPSLADTRRLVIEAARQGADVVEIGIPFSDPLADGPVIQRAAQRALDLVGGVAHDHSHRPDTGLRQSLELVLGQGLAPDLQQRLGSPSGVVPEPAAASGGEDQCLHGHRSRSQG